MRRPQLEQLSGGEDELELVPPNQALLLSWR